MNREEEKTEASELASEESREGGREEAREEGRVVPDRETESRDVREGDGGGGER